RPPGGAHGPGDPVSEGAVAGGLHRWRAGGTLISAHRLRRGDPMNARSAAAIASSRVRIVRSRRRIHASRILTRPIRGGDGSGPTVSPIDLRQRIRAMIVTGELPA